MRWSAQEPQPMRRPVRAQVLDLPEQARVQQELQRALARQPESQVRVKRVPQQEREQALPAREP